MNHDERFIQETALEHIKRLEAKNAALVAALESAQNICINALCSGYCKMTPGIQQDMQQFLAVAREVKGGVGAFSTP